jgi:hypothetical protein
VIRAEPPFFAVEPLEAVVEQIRIPMAIGEPSAPTAPRRLSRPRSRLTAQAGPPRSGGQTRCDPMTTAPRPAFEYIVKEPDYCSVNRVNRR